MEKKKVDVLEQMQNMTIDLNSKALIEKAEKDGVETVYVAYNLIVYPSSFEALKRQDSRKQSLISGLIAGVLMTVPWFITYFAFMGYYPDPDVLGATVPWLVILKQVGGTWTIILFGIVMGWTLIETSTGIIHAFVARVNAGLVDFGKNPLSPTHKKQGLKPVTLQTNPISSNAFSFVNVFRYPGP